MDKKTRELLKLVPNKKKKKQKPVVKVDEPTMSSSQFADILGYDKKEVNKKIVALFGEQEAREKFSPDLDNQNRVIEYHLPEVESNMFVAKWDIAHLRTVSEYFVKDKNESKISTGNHILDALIETQLQINTNATEIAEVKNEVIGIDDRVSELEDILPSVDNVPPNYKTTSYIYGVFPIISKENTKDLLRRELSPRMFRVTTDYGVLDVDHYDLPDAMILLSRIKNESQQVSDKRWTHPLIPKRFQLTL